MTVILPKNFHRIVGERCCFFFSFFFSSTRDSFFDRIFVPLSTKFGRKRYGIHRDNIVMQSNRDYFSFGSPSPPLPLRSTSACEATSFCTSCKRREVFLLRRFADPRRDRRLKTGEKERESEWVRGREREREKRRGSRLKTNTLPSRGEEERGERARLSDFFALRHVHA